MSVALEALSQTVEVALTPLRIRAQEQGPAPEPPSMDPARAVQAAAGGFMGALSLPTQLAETGLAVATNAVSSMLPAFPAATMGSLYMGVPHAHAHPPSLIPPAPPIPLPSIGSILLGTAVNVLIGGVPAARAGDLGMAPTCVGMAPFFSIMLGSSKVFIGGMRAARTTDMCTSCTPNPSAGIVRSASTALKAAAKVSAVASQAAMVAGIVADATDIATEQASVAAASAISLGMQAATLAADAAASAIAAALGTDPALPPALPGFITTGAGNVQIAGMPMPNIPDLAQLLFKRVKGNKKKGEHDDEGPGKKKSGSGCKKLRPRK